MCRGLVPAVGVLGCQPVQFRYGQTPLQMRPVPRPNIIASNHPRSREAHRLRGLPGAPDQKGEGAERRQAQGCLRGTRWSGPITQARASPRRPLSQAAQPGDARLSALHRGGLLASSPPGDAFGRCLARRCPQASPSAFAGPARSGGRAVSLGASREPGYEPNTQDAASRSDSGSSPETPSVSGMGRTIGVEIWPVNEKIPIMSCWPAQAFARSAIEGSIPRAPFTHLSMARGTEAADMT
jgi:hypothetical protein